MQGKQFTVNPSPTVSTQRVYLFEAQLHILSPDYFKLLKDTLRYKVVSQGTLQVTEVDNARFSDVDTIPFTLSN